MLEQDRIATARWIEEGRAEIAIGQQHGDRAGKHWQRQQQQEGGHQHRPREQRHLVQGHARRAHVEDGGDEVDGAEDRRRAGDMKREDREIHRRSGMARCRQRRIHRPAGARPVRARSTLDEHRQDQQREGNGEQPERNVVEARKGHVRRADHDRHHPVGETADQRRHDHEEDHDQAVTSGEDVIKLRIAEDLQAGLLELHAHRDGETTADDARADREDQVERPDVLVIRRIDPARPAGRLVSVMGVVGGAIGHCRSPSNPVGVQRPATAMPSAESISAVSCALAFSRSCEAAAYQVANCSFETTRMAIGML